MPETMNYIHALADEIGPRPVSSEEEQRSADRIAGWLSEKGLDPHVEEFECPTWTSWPYLAAFLVMTLSVGLTWFHGIVAIFTLVLALIALGVTCYERFSGGALSRRFHKGISQNVVARHVPRGAVDDPRAHKIVIVAHYDTARGAVESTPSLVNGNLILKRIVFGCMVAIPVLMVVQMLPFEAIRRWMWLLSCFVVLFPLIAAVIILVNRFATSFPDGANDNASGVAVMMSVADNLIGEHGGDFSKVGHEEIPRPRVRDERRAREARVLPSETEIDYRAFSDHREPVVESPASFAPSVKPSSPALAEEFTPQPPAVPVVAEEAIERPAGGAPARPFSAATGSVQARSNRPQGAPLPQQRAEREPSSDKPEWWTRVESKRKHDVLDTEHAESVMKARSRFADIPSTSYRRPEAEEEPNGEIASEAVPATAPVGDRPFSGYQPSPASRMVAAETVPSESKPSDTTYVPLDIANSSHRDFERGGEEAHPESSAAPSPIPHNDTNAVLESLFGEVKAAAAMESAGPTTTSEVASPRRDSRLMNIPSVDGFESGTFEPVSSAASPIIDDAAFGAPQAAPLAGGYSDTPQNPSFGASFNPAEASGPATPIDPSGELSPFAAGAFTAGETGAFIPVGNTQAFAPLAGMDDDLFIDDADDSSVDIMPTVGDFNAPASIDIPESRGHRFLDNMNDLFHRRKKRDERQQSASDWLGVDEDYDARDAGRTIGSWDNFDEKDGWKGGASVYPGMPDDICDDVRERVGEMARRDLLDKEVWFVALGASSVDHAGMKEFLAAHDHELRGATIINLDCVGAGEICYLEREGLGRGHQSDHHMQALIRKLSRDMDGTVEIETLDWNTTDATPALAAGYRAITVMGFDRKAPVAWRQSSDRSDIIEQSRLDLTVDLVTRMVRNG